MCLHWHSLEVVFPVSLTDSLFLYPLDWSVPLCMKFWKVERILSPPGTLHCHRPYYMPLFLHVSELSLMLRSGRLSRLTGSSHILGRVTQSVWT
ncbi:hypothetical protein PILCRDRAFT_640938 [Piloderma croceum F 1598]|uniref:Uncharacterized protein n=1 Tax=Piloderma croceum (strain F 1598) TaxID=765440 RepID=A0A0C3FAG7_PILCF|nr:hypothetical protein PILCRDRAFT_640938 [Piloderma croceum F 1598]